MKNTKFKTISILEKRKCKKSICEKCSQDHSFKPSDEGINTSIDVIQKLLDRYVANVTATTITTIVTDMKKVKKADPNV